MSDITVRRARKQDLAAVLALDASAFPPGKGYNALVVRQLFDAAPEFFVVAEAQGRQLSGYAAALPGTEAHSAWVAVLAVAPQHRRSGVAGALCQALFDALGRSEIRRIYFTVRPDNVPVLRLAETHGFVRTGEEPDYFGPGEARLLLCWDRDRTAA